jgi:hypothetical protein
VTFRSSDAFLPDSDTIYAHPEGAEELEGTIVGFSDSGDIIRAFALVEVLLKRIVIVRSDRLRKLNGEVTTNDRKQ